MKHFVITRFNLKSEQWKASKDGTQVLTEEWLDQRFSLFERFCFPSVLNQSCPDFFWLIFFDVSTPEIYRKRISKLTNPYKHINVYYVDGFKNLMGSLKKEVREFLDERDEYIITTRLDNDDAIHNNFIRVIQNEAIKEHEVLIDLRKGFQINVLKEEYEVKEYYSSYNQFLSLVEDSRLFETVLSRMHKDWGSMISKKVVNDHPYWIEIIHERNKLNDFKKYLSYSNKLKGADFGITVNLKERSNYKIVLLNIFKVFPYKTARFIYRIYKTRTNV